MPADSREYYSRKDVQKPNIPASNNGSLSPGHAVDTKPLSESFNPSTNDHPIIGVEEEHEEDDDDAEDDDVEDEDESPESEQQTVQLAKLRLQKIMEDSSPEVLEEEVKKTNDFLDVLKNLLKVPEAKSNQDTTHWVQQIGKSFQLVFYLSY